MIDQDRLETNFLQLFAHTKVSEWFSIISVVSFEVSIFAKHVNAKRLTIMHAILHWTQTIQIFVEFKTVYHEFKTVCLGSVQKRTHNSQSFRIYMFSNNADLKTKKQKL